MRKTLVELQAMADDKLFEHWELGRFPFDFAPCNNCLTGHSFDSSYSSTACRHVEHRDFHMQAVAVLGARHSVYGGADLRPWLEQIYALRLFYDHLYAQPAEQAEAPIAPVVEQERTECHCS